MGGRSPQSPLIPPWLLSLGKPRAKPGVSGKGRDAASETISLLIKTHIRHQHIQKTLLGIDGSAGLVNRTYRWL